MNKKDKTKLRNTLIRTTCRQINYVRVVHRLRNHFITMGNKRHNQKLKVPVKF